MIKQDINLIPRRKSVSASTVVSVFLVILILAVLTVAGIYLPKYALEIKQDKLTELQNELAGFDNIELVYIQKMNEFTSLSTRMKNYNNFISSERQVFGLLEKIDNAVPEGVLIVDQVFNKDNIVLDGVVSDDLIAADFEEALRGLNIFSDIYLDSLTGKQGQRMFRMTLMHAEVTTSEVKGDE